MYSVHKDDGASGSSVSPVAMIERVVGVPTVSLVSHGNGVRACIAGELPSRSHVSFTDTAIL